MKSITTIKNYKKEEYQKNFRLRIMYTAVLDGSIVESSKLTEILGGMGFDKKVGSMFADFDRDIYAAVNENKLSVAFEQNQENSFDRQKVANDVFRTIVEQLEFRITALAVYHLNRYVLTNFSDLDVDRKRALAYFFTKEFSTEEEIIYKEDNLLVYSQVEFSENTVGSFDLDFPIYVCRLINPSEAVDLMDLFRDMDLMSYRYWRSATSKVIIDEMKRVEDE